MKNNDCKELIGGIELENAERRFNEIFTGKDFPEKVFKSDSFVAYFIESITVFEEDMYNNFLTLLDALGEEYFYCYPETTCHDVNKFMCLRNCSLSDFHAKVEVEESYENINCYIFGRNINWGIYIYFDYNFLVYGCEASLVPLFDKHLLKNQYLLTFSELLDLFEVRKGHYLYDYYIDNIKLHYSSKLRHHKS